MSQIESLSNVVDANYYPVDTAVGVAIYLAGLRPGISTLSLRKVTEDVTDLDGNDVQAAYILAKIHRQIIPSHPNTLLPFEWQVNPEDEVAVAVSEQAEIAIDRGKVVGRQVLAEILERHATVEAAKEDYQQACRVLHQD